MTKYRYTQRVARSRESDTQSPFYGRKAPFLDPHTLINLPKPHFPTSEGSCSRYTEGAVGKKTPSWGENRGLVVHSGVMEGPAEGTGVENQKQRTAGRQSDLF